MWLSAYIFNWLAGWLVIYQSMFLCLVVTFWLPFHSNYLAPSATALSKSSTIVQMFSLINILNCLPPLIFVLKRICTRLTILTGSKNNHKIKLCSGQLAVGMHLLDCKYILFYHFRKCWSHWLPVWGGGRRERGSVEKEGVRIKRASHYLILIYIIYSRLVCFIQMRLFACMHAQEVFFFSNMI